MDPATRAFSDAIAMFSDAFRPILVAKEGSAGRKVKGTALVVGEGSRRYVLTAHHVVDTPEAKYIGVIGADTIAWPQKYSKLAARYDGLPDPDIAWATATVLEGDTALSAFVPMALARAVIPDSHDAAYAAVGFPASKSKLWHGKQQLATKLMSAFVTKAPNSKWKELRLDDRVHFACTYSQTSRTSLNGQPMVGSHPSGMSGGALFAMMRQENDPSSVQIPFLVGILTRYYEEHETLVATRASHVWNAIGSTRMSDPFYTRVDA